MKGLGLASAFRLITAIPVPGAECENIRQTMCWFPGVGLFLGLCGYLLVSLILWLSQHSGLALPGTSAGMFVLLLAAVLVVSLWALLTRGFHLDGLADTCDGFGGGWTKERILEIMKDSRSGSFGVLALVLAVLLKVAALAAVLACGNLWAVLCAPVVARLMMVAQACFNQYARNTGTGAAVISQSDGRVFAVSCGGTLVLLLAILPASCYLGASASLLLAAASALTLGWVSRRKIGGVTGDVLGATCELAESAALVAAIFC